MNFIFLILIILLGLTLALPPTYDYFLFICNIGFCKKCAKLVATKETRENRISRYGWNISQLFLNSCAEYFSFNNCADFWHALEAPWKHIVVKLI